MFIIRRPGCQVMKQGNDSRRPADGKSVSGAFATAVIAALYAILCLNAQLHAAPQVTDRATPPYRLGPGDQVSVSVWKHESLSLALTIAPDGKINYPLAGEIHSSGLTLLELQDRIAGGLREHLRNPQVSVTLQDARSYRVYVLGEVMQPGKQVLDGETSLIQSIAMAGGFTPFAETENIVVYRPAADSGNRIKFNYKRFIKHDPEMPDIKLRAGDTIIVN